GRRSRHDELSAADGVAGGPRGGAPRRGRLRVHRSRRGGAGRRRGVRGGGRCGPPGGGAGAPPGGRGGGGHPARPAPGGGGGGAGGGSGGGEVGDRVREPSRGGTPLVELKAVAAGYPLYGRLETEPARPLAQLLGADGAVVNVALLDRLGLRVGDPVLIGAGRFRITGILRKEPDRSAGVFSLGPRGLIDAAALDRTRLGQLGSRVRYRTLVRLPEALEPRATRAALLRQLPDPAIRITAYDEAEPGLRRFFGQLTTYLGLVGLVSLLVGGIGVAA